MNTVRLSKRLLTAEIQNKINTCRYMCKEKKKGRTNLQQSSVMCDKKGGEGHFLLSFCGTVFTVFCLNGWELQAKEILTLAHSLLILLLTTSPSSHEQNYLADKEGNDLLCHQATNSTTFWHTRYIILTVFKASSTELMTNVECFVVRFVSSVEIALGKKSAQLTRRPNASQLRS